MRHIKARAPRLKTEASLRLKEFATSKEDDSMVLKEFASQEYAVVSRETMEDLQQLANRLISEVGKEDPIIVKMSKAEAKPKNRLFWKLGHALGVQEAVSIIYEKHNFT